MLAGSLADRVKTDTEDSIEGCTRAVTFLFLGIGTRNAVLYFFLRWQILRRLRGKLHIAMEKGQEAI